MRSAGSAAALLWRDLPFWCLWLSPFALLSLEVNVLRRPPLPALWYFLLPFLVVTLVWHRKAPRRGAWLGYLASSALLLGAVLSGLTGAPLERGSLLRAFEIVALTEFLLLAAHCAWMGGRGTFALIFGVGLIYGLVLENGGVMLGFFSEQGYRFYAPGLPAPLCTALGWCNLWYPLWWVVPGFAGAQASPATQARVATGLALALDLQLDPAATAAGFWVWNPMLPAVVRGVPIVNFNAWFSAVWPFAHTVFGARALRGSMALRVLIRLPLVLAAALVVVLGLSLLTEFGSGWPSLMIFGRAARDLAGWFLPRPG